jgi:hypothetical protein
MITFAGDKRLVVVGRAEGSDSEHDSSRGREVSRGTSFLRQSIVETKVAGVIFIINVHL